MSHAPGPWTWRVPANGGPGYVPVDWATWRSTGYIYNPQLFDAHGAAIVGCDGEYTPVHGENSEELAANANLIAAAPELLGALKWYVHYHGNTNAPIETFEGYLGVAERAIAKAEGK